MDLERAVESLNVVRNWEKPKAIPPWLRQTPFLLQGLLSVFVYFQGLLSVFVYFQGLLSVFVYFQGPLSHTFRSFCHLLSGATVYAC